MQKIRALIIDDEPLARQLVRENLSGFAEVEILAECGDGYEALRQANLHAPELLFLDIQMPKINGFELLEVLGYQPAVIFITAYEEYAIKAFESNAVDYLLKPFARDRFARAVSKAIAGLNQGQPQSPQLEELAESAQGGAGSLTRVVTREGNKIEVIPVEKIFYIETADDYVYLHTANGRFIKDKPMKYFEKMLPAKDFVRIHRSFLLNIAQISGIEPYTKDTFVISLKCGAKLRASADGYSRLKKAL